MAAALHAGHDPDRVREWSLRDLQRFAETLPLTDEGLPDD